MNKKTKTATNVVNIMTRWVATIQDFYEANIYQRTYVIDKHYQNKNTNPS